MSRIRNAITARERLAWYLLMVIVILVIALGHAHWQLATMQKKFTMHIPPDVSQGALLTPDMPGKPNVYMYVHYIWRALNTWKKDGVEDYKKAIDSYACYVSPDFLEWLQADYERERTGDLSDKKLVRTRDITAINFYTDDYVQALGNGTWYVWLDMVLEERVVGEIVKNPNIRYSLYAYLDKRDCNVLGVSIGGFFAESKRL